MRGSIITKNDFSWRYPDLILHKKANPMYEDITEDEDETGYRGTWFGGPSLGQRSYVKHVP